MTEEVKPKGKRKLPQAFKDKIWKPGESGNPKGKPKGAGKIVTAARREIEIAANLRLADNARQLLQDESLPLVREVVQIALARDLRPGLREVEQLVHALAQVKEKPGGKWKDLLAAVKSLVGGIRDEVYPTPHKVKCLLACLDRIVPSLKVVELNQGTDGKQPGDMTDAEILGMMERMARLVQAGRDYREGQAALPEELDG